jgi:hypothetical protein
MFEKKDFDFSGGIVQPSWDHPAVIENEKIGGEKVAGQISETPMQDVPAFSIQYQHPRPLALLGGTIRDQFRREIVVVILKVIGH